MFFKRAKKDNQSPDDAPVAAAQAPSAGGAEAASVSPVRSNGSTALVSERPATDDDLEGDASPARRLTSDDLTAGLIGSRDLGFETTAQLEPDEVMPGFDGVVAALRLVFADPQSRAHLLVLTPDNTFARESLIAATAREAGATRRTEPCDWIYVQDLPKAVHSQAPLHAIRSDRPMALRLPRGKAMAFAAAMRASIAEAGKSLVAAFQSDDYRARRRAIHERFRGAHEEAMETLELTAREQNIALLRSPTGFAFAPMLDGKVVKPEVFSKLPPSMQAEVNQKVDTLTVDLKTILENGPKAERARRIHLAQLREDVAAGVIDVIFADLRAAFAEIEAARDHIDAVAADFRALVSETDGADAEGGASEAGLSRWQLRYAVLPVAAAEDLEQDRSVVVFDPVSETLAGTIAGGGGRAGGAPHVGQLRAGALHRACGRALIIEASELISDPAERQVLREVLRSGRIPFRRGRGPERASALASLDPQPIPLECTIIVRAGSDCASRLSKIDPELCALLSATAHVPARIDANPQNRSQLASFLKAVLDRENLPQCSAAAAAAIMNGIAGHRPVAGMLPLPDARLRLVLREAAAHVRQDGRDIIDIADLETAQASLAAPAAHVQAFIDALPRHAIGQAVFAVEQGDGPHHDARAHSALAVVSSRLVSPKSTDAGTADPLLAMALAAALDTDCRYPLPGIFAASGPAPDMQDTAMPPLARLCALVSRLAWVPLRQDIIVAAGLDPTGKLTGIENPNAIIETVFDACQGRASGNDAAVAPGVIIATANARDLNLPGPILKAVREDRFVIWSAATALAAVGVLSRTEDSASLPEEAWLEQFRRRAVLALEGDDRDGPAGGAKANTP